MAFDWKEMAGELANVVDDLLRPGSQQTNERARERAIKALKEHDRVREEEEALDRAELPSWAEGNE